MDAYRLIHGDCLEELRKLPENSVDSLVTDPPAFIDFMDKSWDTTHYLWKYLWLNNSFVDSVKMFLKKTRLESGMDVPSFVHENANIHIEQILTAGSQKSVQCAMLSLSVTNPKTKGFVDLLVLTSQEVRGLLSGLSQNHIVQKDDMAAGDTGNALYAIPLLLPETETTNTVPKSVITNIKKLCSAEKATLLTLTDAQSLNDAIEARIGIELEIEFSNETRDFANAVVKDRSDEKYSVTILRPIDLQKITPYLTLLLCALVATEKSKNIQSYLASNFMECVFKECLRIMKPGAHGLVWAIPRTSHWTATALEDAGFEVRDVVTHITGQGFPKALDISKAIDKAAGVQREKYLKPIAYADSDCWGVPNNNSDGSYESTSFNTHAEKVNIGAGMREHSLPSTPEAKLWQGFGTALKPASEHWILVRKPCSEKTVAANVLKWGCGGLNIDASRIGTSESLKGGQYSGNERQGANCYGKHKNLTPEEFKQPQGRFPANLVLSHNEDCRQICLTSMPPQYKWECTPGCAVAELDRQSGERGNNYRPNHKNHKSVPAGIFGISHSGVAPNDSGGASRFFKTFENDSRFLYCAKASKRERNEGCEGLSEKLWAQSGGAQSALARGETEYHTETQSGYDTVKSSRNHHPTVKPIRLMQYLITMVTPPNGTVLDPFMGSGSTGVAALRSGFKFIGIERESEYMEICKARVEGCIAKIS